MWNEISQWRRCFGTMVESALLVFSTACRPDLREFHVIAWSPFGNLWEETLGEVDSCLFLYTTDSAPMTEPQLIRPTQSLVGKILCSVCLVTQPRTTSLRRGFNLGLIASFNPHVTPRLDIQVCTFHDGCKQGIDHQIFNRKLISRKITHPQSL